MGPPEYLAALAKRDLCGVILVGCSQESCFGEVYGQNQEHPGHPANQETEPGF